jgi:hypothetical protein
VIAGMVILSAKGDFTKSVSNKCRYRSSSFVARYILAKYTIAISDLKALRLFFAIFCTLSSLW